MVSACGCPQLNTETTAVVPGRSCQQEGSLTPPQLVWGQSWGVSGLSTPSPEGVPEWDVDEYCPLALTLHCGSSLAAEGAAGAEGEDGKELQEREMGLGGLRPWGDPLHPWGAVVSPGTG